MKLLRLAPFALMSLLAGCSEPDRDISGAIVDRDQFDEVSPMLVARCGTLDCHGDTYRNYRLHGVGGLRLDPRHLPDFPDTTDEEVDRNYEATVSIEPEVMQRIADGDLDAIGDLTLVRKALGAEAHEGGAVLPRDGDGERCLLSWLAGGVDRVACEAASVP